MKVGVLGGTFDPVHNGHITMAEEVMAALRLDRVIFVPAGQPWLKADSPITPVKHRAEMVRLAIAGRAGFELSLVEVERPGPSFTIDTIDDLRKQLGDEAELYFIIGWDSLAQMPQWKDVGRLVKLCRMVSVPRPGWEMPDLRKLEELIPGISQSLILLDKPVIDISATDIRRRVAGDLSLRGLVPEAVADYIRQHKLYLTGEETLRFRSG